MDNQNTPDWLGYYNAQTGRQPRSLLLDVLQRFAPAASRFAIDLGCGEGTETRTLLEQGWQVLAIDQEPAAIQLVMAQTPAAYRARLTTQVATFAKLRLPVADLLYAGYSLPFCAPAHFPALWAQIGAAIPVGGRFAGQLFGERDTWAARADMTFHTAAQARGLFSTFTIESWQEVEEEGASFAGPKHWHLFHIIACKTS